MERQNCVTAKPIVLPVPQIYSLNDPVGCRNLEPRNASHSENFIISKGWLRSNELRGPNYFSLIAPDVTEAMLAERTTGNFDSIIMQNVSYIFLLFCTKMAVLSRECDERTQSRTIRFRVSFDQAYSDKFRLETCACSERKTHILSQIWVLLAMPVHNNVQRRKMLLHLFSLQNEFLHALVCGPVDERFCPFIQVKEA